MDRWRWSILERKDDSTLDFLMSNLGETVSGLLKCLKKVDVHTGTMWEDVQEGGEDHPLYKCLKCNNPYNINSPCPDYRSKYNYHKKKVGEDV